MFKVIIENFVFITHKKDVGSILFCFTKITEIHRKIPFYFHFNPDPDPDSGPDPVRELLLALAAAVAVAVAVAVATPVWYTGCK